MRETSVRPSTLAFFVLCLFAVSSFAQSASDRQQSVPPVGRYRSESLTIAPASIYFSGNYSYSYTVGSTCTLHADSAVNSNAGATGPLRFALWFTTAAYPSSGTIGAAYQFTSSLAAGASMTNIQGTVPFTNPPAGCYNVTFVLEELVGGTWTMRDYGGFTKSADSGNGCIASFTASPTSIAPAGSSTLSWTTLGSVNGVTIDNGVGAQPASGTKSVSPSATTTYTLSANNTATTPAPSKTATVTVNAPPPAPTATFSASPTSIASGASSTLTWSTTNATSVSLDNGIGAVALNGSKIVSPSATTTYTLTVSGSGGTITKTATVTVTGPAQGLSVTASGSPLSGTAPFTTSFSATGHGGTPPYTFKWSTGETTAQMSHQWATPGTFTVTVTVADATSAKAVSNTLPVTVNAAPSGPCSDPQYVCLGGSRFAVKIDWKTNDGASSGVAVPIKYTPDSGLFWFFGPDNIEVLLKVLNACSLNGKYWIFSAATTDVEYTITVLDTVSGNQKTYFHAGGTPAPAITDTDGLPCTGGLTNEAPGAIVGATSTLAILDGPSLPNATNLCTDPNYVCLGGNRFAVKIDWKTNDGASSGVAAPIKYTPDSGLFWFFGPDNIEVLLKVLNGCALNSKYWVFSAATTDVEYTITVTDTQTGKTKTYFHAGGTPAPAITDTDAMACQ